MAGPNGRHPPHDLAAETALLGTIFWSREGADAAISAGVTARSFYSPAHGAIFDAIANVRARGDVVNVTTLASELQKTGTLRQAGGRDALHAIAAETGMASTAYARTVLEHAQARRYLALFGEGTTAIYEGRDVAPVLEELDAEEITTTSSWVPIDLGPILAGDLTPPQPAVLARDDGHFLLYPGRVHTFQGESESLKSWLALMATAQELSAGHHVVYLDFEDTAESILRRLLDLSVHRDALLTRFTYVRPLQSLDVGSLHRLERHITDTAPTLAVIDGVTEAMSLEGYDLLDNKDVATWLGRLPRRIADLGPAVAMIDHVTKSKETRDRYAIGAQHKLAGIDGAAYSIDPVRPLAHLSAGSSTPVTGVSKITIAKDRPGAVRGFAASNRHVGELHLTAYPDGGITGHIVPAIELPEGGFRPTVLMLRISELLASVAGPLTKRAIRGAVKGKNDTKDLALELLVAEGYIVVEPGPKGAQLHRHVRVYREDHPEPDEQESLDGDAF